VHSRHAGGRAQDPTPSVLFLPTRQRHAERASCLPHDGLRGRLPERCRDPGGVSLRTFREVHGQRFHRYRTGIPEHRRRLLAELRIGHVAQMAPGSGDHGSETPQVRLHEKAGGIHR